MRATTGVFGSLPHPSMQSLRHGDRSSLTMRLSRSSSPDEIPTTVKILRTAPPTLATGRRSKFIPLEGEAAIKRDLRRRRNREVARKLKMKRAAMECELEQQLDQLESEEQQLLCQVHFLQNYKFHLERQHHIIAMHERLIREMKVSPIEHEEIKREPRCPSPQWLALFHI